MLYEHLRIEHHVGRLYSARQKRQVYCERGQMGDVVDIDHKVEVSERPAAVVVGNKHVNFRVLGTQSFCALRLRCS